MDKNLHQNAKAPMIALIHQKNIVENKMKRAFVLLLLLGLMMPLAMQAQDFGNTSRVSNCRIPTDFQASEITPQSVVLSWTENGEATAWIVAYKTVEDNGFTEVNATENPFTLTGLTPETEYTVKVKPVCDVDDKWSNEIQFTTLVACPAPEDLQVDNLTTTTATLSWIGFSQDYGVYYRTSAYKGGRGATAGEWETLLATEPTITLTNLTPKTTYEAKVQGDCGDEGLSELSEIITFTTGLFDGSGTEDDPYIIATTDDMDELASQVNNGNNQSGVYFLQTDTLNYTGKTYTPVGNNTNYFQGNYNGNGNIITGVDINTEYAGLFGRVGENGVVSNLTLDGIVSYCYIYGNYAGGIAAVNQGEIVGCSVLSSIIGLEKDYGIWIFEKYVHIVGDRIGGGVVGDNRGNVYDAVCTALIECGYNNGNNTTGGLVGTNDGQVNGIFGGVIYNSGIMSVGVVGGLVGKQYNGSLSGINRGYFNGNDSHWNLIRNGNQFRAEWTGCIVGSQVAGTVENCIYVGNRWNKFVESNHAGAIISSYEDGVLRNNYYVGECEINGMYNSINGSVDVTGQAMRGYKIESQDPLVINLEGNIGLTYEGNVYAGNEQGVVVSFEIQNSSLTPQCYAFSAGTLEDNGDGTYTITMPAEDITIAGNIVESYGTYYEIPCEGGTTATVVYDASYATLEWASIEDFEYQGTFYAVTAIANNAFDGCTELTGVSCHTPQLATIGANAFRNCTGIMSFGFYHTATPPAVGEGAFENVPWEDILLGVPYCSQYDYSQHEVFGQSGAIQGYDGCEYNFTGFGDDMLWSNLDNWLDANMEPCTEAPGEGAQVAIFTDCEIDVDLTVGSITTGNYEEVIPLTVKAGKTLTATEFVYTANNAENFIIEDGAQVIHPNAGAMATVEKNITAYTPNSKNGWHLVSSPAIESFAPSMDNGFLANEYDLYFYDEPAHYWRNYKPNGQYAGFSIEPLKGYLYANSANNTLGLTGTLRAATETVNVPLSYTTGIPLAGFNLVANPFAHNVTAYTGSNVAEECFRINGTKDNLIVCRDLTADPLKPGEGFFVKATGEDATITFNANAKGETEVLEPVERPNPQASERSLNLEPVERPKGATIQLEITQNGLLIDRFILKRDGAPLEKFTLNENSTRIFATRDRQDWATIPMEGNEQTVSFKAAKDGTYTLRVNVGNMDLDYLHLIDNMTGADVDLLVHSAPEHVEGSTQYDGVSTGSTTCYTFTAKTTDYASRFRLVFNADDASTGSASDAPFAFVNNGNIVITADADDATLQVIDMMGRVIRTVGLSQCGSRTITGMSPGVYVLRLIDGDSIKTQKMVIE